MQHNHVNLQSIHVNIIILCLLVCNRQHNYVNIRLNNVDMQHKYFNNRLNQVVCQLNYVVC